VFIVVSVYFVIDSVRKLLDTPSYNPQRPFSDADLNVCAQTEEKSDDMEDSFYKKLQGIFDQFPKYLIKSFVRRFQ
jgi:hypothetical protein